MFCDEEKTMAAQEGRNYCHNIEVLNKKESTHNWTITSVLWVYGVIDAKIRTNMGDA